MMILEIIKIDNGLDWFSKPKFFTTESLENSYIILDEYHVHIELNNTIYCFDSREVVIENLTFTNSNELINYIFNNA